MVEEGRGNETSCNHGRSNLACGSQPKCHRPTISKRRNLGTGGNWGALQRDSLKNNDDGARTLRPAQFTRPVPRPQISSAWDRTSLPTRVVSPHKRSDLRANFFVFVRTKIGPGGSNWGHFHPHWDRTYIGIMGGPIEPSYIL